MADINYLINLKRRLNQNIPNGNLLFNLFKKPPNLFDDFDQMLIKCFDLYNVSLKHLIKQAKDLGQYPTLRKKCSVFFQKTNFKFIKSLKKFKQYLFFKS